MLGAPDRRRPPPAVHLRPAHGRGRTVVNGAIPGCIGCATPVLTLQVWASHWLHSHPHVIRFMNSIYGWPLCETLHFFGLSLLVGTVGVFDLRVLGIARRIPIDALQRLTRWGIVGWGLNLVTGLMFLMTFPNQYIYQWP